MLMLVINFCLMNRYERTKIKNNYFILVFHA
jgi:hypothetical protein